MCNVCPSWLNILCTERRGTCLHTKGWITERDIYLLYTHLLPGFFRLFKHPLLFQPVEGGIKLSMCGMSLNTRQQRVAIAGTVRFHLSVTAAIPAGLGRLHANLRMSRWLQLMLMTMHLQQPRGMQQYRRSQQRLLIFWLTQRQAYTRGAHLRGRMRCLSRKYLGSREHTRTHLHMWVYIPDYWFGCPLSLQLFTGMVLILLLFFSCTV
jgi:hypothetical protein